MVLLFDIKIRVSIEWKENCGESEIREEKVVSLDYFTLKQRFSNCHRNCAGN
jgi:hypothetical protein